MLYHIDHKSVAELQEWLLHNVLYHIDHKSVAEVQEWFLHHVLYHIDHKSVAEVQEWFLHHVLYHIDHRAVPGLPIGFYIICFSVVNTYNDKDEIYVNLSE